MNKYIHIARMAKAVDATLASILTSEFAVDPILGSDLSKLVSQAASIQRRHGTLLKASVVAALRASGRYEVVTSTQMPITSEADRIAGSMTRDTLERIALRYDTPVTRVVNVDLIAIDAGAGWAGAFECKRGNGPLTSRLMKSLVRDLECVSILLREFLHEKGYTSVERVAVGIIDFYGYSGAPSYLAINQENLDGFFGVPVNPMIVAMNMRLANGFRSVVPSLLAAASDLDGSRTVLPPCMMTDNQVFSGLVARLPNRISARRRRSLAQLGKVRMRAGTSAVMSSTIRTVGRAGGPRRVPKMHRVPTSGSRPGGTWPVLRRRATGRSRPFAF